MSWAQIAMMVVALWIVWIIVRPFGLLAYSLLKAIFAFAKEVFVLLTRIVVYFNRRNQRNKISTGKPTVLVTGDNAFHLN